MPNPMLDLLGRREMSRDQIQCGECHVWHYVDTHPMNCVSCHAVMPGLCKGCGCCHCSDECEGTHNCFEVDCECVRHLRDDIEIDDGITRRLTGEEQVDDEQREEWAIARRQRELER